MEWRLPFCLCLVGVGSVNTTRKEARIKRRLVHSANEFGAHDLIPDDYIRDEIVPNDGRPHSKLHSKRLHFIFHSKRLHSFYKQFNSKRPCIPNFTPKRPHLPTDFIPNDLMYKRTSIQPTLTSPQTISFQTTLPSPRNDPLPKPAAQRSLRPERDTDRRRAQRETADVHRDCQAFRVLRQKISLGLISV